MGARWEGLQFIFHQVFKYRYAEFSMYRGSNSVLAPIIKHSAANPLSAREHSKEIIMQQRSRRNLKGV